MRNLTRMFGSTLADVFSTPAYDCRLIGSDEMPEFADYAAPLGAAGNGEGADVSPGSGGPDLCVSLARGDWPVEGILQRQERWSDSGDSVRDNFHRSQLPDGNVGARPV